MKPGEWEITAGYWLKCFACFFNDKDLEEAEKLGLDKPEGEKRACTIALSEVVMFYDCETWENERCTSVDLRNGASPAILIPYDEFEALHKAYREGRAWHTIKAGNN